MQPSSPVLQCSAQNLLQSALIISDPCMSTQAHPHQWDLALQIKLLRVLYACAVANAIAPKMCAAARRLYGTQCRYMHDTQRLHGGQQDSHVRTVSIALVARQCGQPLRHPRARHMQPVSQEALLVCRLGKGGCKADKQLLHSATAGRRGWHRLGHRWRESCCQVWQMQGCKGGPLLRADMHAELTHDACYELRDLQTAMPQTAVAG